MNALYTSMTQTRRFNYPPGGEQLMSFLDVLGPLDKGLCTAALVSVGASGDAYKAGLTVKTLKRSDLITERKGLLYMCSRDPNPLPDAELLLSVFVKFSKRETALYRNRQPSRFSFSPPSASGLVYETAVFDDTKIVDALEFVEYKKLNRLVKPIVVLKQNHRPIGAPDIKKIFGEKKEIAVVAVNEGAVPVYFEDGKPMAAE